MRIFITGATGFIGSAVVKELIDGGHQVLGLARTDGAAGRLTAAGAEVQRGALEDIESLKSGTAASDAVIHLGMSHDFANILKNFETDKQAIEAMGSVLAGSDRPLIVAAGLAGLAGPGQIATEESVVPPDFPFPRVSEQTALAQVSKGVCASVMRLPQVHDTRKQGLITFAIATAREKGAAAYVGNGANRWAAAHVSDVARLYRLALEKPEAGATVSCGRRRRRADARHSRDHRPRFADAGNFNISGKSSRLFWLVGWVSQEQTFWHQAP